MSEGATAATPRPGGSRLLSGLALDRIEQAVIVLLYGALVWRILPGSLAGHPYLALLLVSEGAVLVFSLIRRRTGAISAEPFDWAVAFGGTIGPLLVVAHGAPFLPLPGTLLMFVGLGINLAAKLYLRRSFGLVAADRGVRTEGLYRFVRHPMYLGYMVTHVGFVLAVPSVWNVLAYAFAWACFLYRIKAEERVLGRNEDYRDYAQRVGSRLVPGVW